jgi:hypothetical protein
MWRATLPPDAAPIVVAPQEVAVKYLLAAALLLVVAMPVAAKDPPATGPTAEQRSCMTWLSLASRFAASEGQRSLFDQKYLRLNRVVSAGTDEVGDASAAEASPNGSSYDQWVMKYDLANDTAKQQIVDELIGHAATCESVVPEDSTNTPG